MQSKQFPSLQEAIDYCKSKGSLKYFGREGPHNDYSDCVYTLTIGYTVYHLMINDNGMLRVVDKT